MNLVYMARPVYGGWVTMTAHLSLTFNFPIFKITKKSEKSKRNFGYGVEYQNKSIDDLIKLDNLVITAIDKNYYEYLDQFPDSTILIIHDPTEVKNKEFVEKIKRFRIFTIRDTVYHYLLNNLGIQSVLKVHPFYQYPLIDNNQNCSYNCLSISRIDFDKHTEIILKANRLIDYDSNKIHIFGAENRLYVHHKLSSLGLKEDFEKYWMKKFPKNLPLTDSDSNNLLNNCEYIVDMSIIKGDGGGTQYTFLEAIYNDCILILHDEWVKQGNLFKDKYNCYVVGLTENPDQEIANIINNPNKKLDKIILKNSKKILETHIKKDFFI
tara:strand:- start:152 stop:1123 length:972 start_codon:yes stop_codon:yes gene_type:complete